MQLLHKEPHTACSASLSSFNPELHVLLPSSRHPGRHRSLLPIALHNPFPDSQCFPTTWPPPSSHSSPSSSHPPLATFPPPVPTPAYLVLPYSSPHPCTRTPISQFPPATKPPAFPHSLSQQTITSSLHPSPPAPASRPRTPLCPGVPCVRPRSLPSAAGSLSPDTPRSCLERVLPSPLGTQPRSPPCRTQRLSPRSSPGTHLRAQSRSQHTASSSPLRTQQPRGLRYSTAPSPQPPGQPELSIACTSPQPHTPNPPPARRASPRRRPAAAHPQPAGGALPPAPNSQTLGGRRPSPGGG